MEAIEAARLSRLHFVAEALDQVFVYDPIGSGEESKDVADEVAFIVVELVLPVVEILGEIHLLGSPEGGFSLLVHLPDLVVLNREENEATLGLDQERLLV